jgi:hypothetical protein
MTIFAMRIKEVMVNMPNNLDTKKKIDEYYKNAMKDIKEKIKENKEDKKIKKRVKKVKVDDDGNEIVKVKKPLNKYKKVILDNSMKVIEKNPDMSGEEIFTSIEINDAWTTLAKLEVEDSELHHLLIELRGSLQQVRHKEDINNVVINDEDKKDSEDNSDDDIEDDIKESS